MKICYYVDLNYVEWKVSWLTKLKLIKPGNTYLFVLIRLINNQGSCLECKFIWVWTLYVITFKCSI